MTKEHEPKGEDSDDNLQHDDRVTFKTSGSFSHLFPDIDDDSRLIELEDGRQQLRRLRGRILNSRLATMFSPEPIEDVNGLDFYDPPVKPLPIPEDWTPDDGKRYALHAPASWHDGLEEPIDDLIEVAYGHKLIKVVDPEGDVLVVPAEKLAPFLMAYKSSLLVHIDSRISQIETLVAAKKLARVAMNDLREAKAEVPYKRRIVANPDDIQSFVDLATYLVDKGLIKGDADGFLDHFSFRGSVARTVVTVDDPKVRYKLTKPGNVPPGVIRWLGIKRHCIAMMAFLGHPKDNETTEDDIYYISNSMEMTEVLAHFVDVEGNPFIPSQSNPERSEIARLVPPTKRPQFEFWLDIPLFTEGLEKLFPFFDTSSRGSSLRKRRT